MKKTMNIQIVKENIPSFSSEKLCDMIVCDRYFGCFKEISIMCMEELSTRRLKGDLFNFEDYIESAIKTLPPINKHMPNLKEILQQTIKIA